MSVSWILAVAFVVGMQTPEATQLTGNAKVEPALVDALARDNEATYLVYLTGRADLTNAAGIADRGSRGWFVYRALKEVASRTQAPLVQFLAGERQSGRVRNFTPFFGVNAIVVTSSAQALARLREFPQV